MVAEKNRSQKFISALESRKTFIGLSALSLGAAALDGATTYIGFHYAGNRGVETNQNQLDFFNHYGDLGILLFPGLTVGGLLTGNLLLRGASAQLNKRGDFVENRKKAMNENLGLELQSSTESLQARENIYHRGAHALNIVSDATLLLYGGGSIITAGVHNLLLFHQIGIL